MVDYIVSGTALDPDTDTPLTGLWAVRRFTSFTDPGEFIADPEHDWSLYVSPGRNASLTLEATAGTELYWAKFTSSDGETVLGPYLFTLTGDRTWNDIIDNPAPTPSTGGALSLVGEEYYAEMSSAQDSNTNLVLDGFSEELDFVGGYLTGLPAGYYRITAQVECTRPAELHALSFEFTANGGGGTTIPVPTISIYPDGLGGIGKNAYFQIHIPINEGAGLSISATSGCVDGTVTPGVLELSYAYFGITRIG